MGMSPQNLNTKFKRKTFTVCDLEQIVEVIGTRFERKIILNDGDSV